MTIWRGLGATNPYAAQIQAAAPSYGIPPALALAVATQESSLNPNAIGPATSSGARAIGLFQLMPATAAGLHVDPTDPSQNITGGLEYLQQLYNQYGDWNTALEAYNWGPGNIASGAAVPGSVQSYASSILAAAGLDSGSGLLDTSTDSSELDLASPTADDWTSALLNPLETSTGLSGTSLALVGVGIIGLVAWLALR
jgi:hypothetical protein